MRWSETVDNVSAYAYLDDDLVIIFRFWRASHPFLEELGKVFVARIPPDEFAAIVEECRLRLKTGSGTHCVIDLGGGFMVWRGHVCAEGRGSRGRTSVV